MAWTYIQGNTASGNGSSGNGLVSLSSSVASGDVLILSYINYQSGSGSITDNLGNTYTKQSSGTSSNVAVEVWTTVVTVPGTVTVSLGGISPYWDLILDEFSPGVTPTFDAHGEATGTGTAASDSVAVAANSSDLVYATLGYDVNGSTATPGAGWTGTAAISGSASHFMAANAAYKLNATTTPQAPTFTIGSSANWQMAAVTISIPATTYSYDPVGIGGGLIGKPASLVN